MALTMLDYFGQLPQGVQSTLFRDPWTCQAILRALTPLAQQYALRLAGAQGPLSAALVRSWAQPTPEAQTKHELAITHLGELGLLSRVTVSGGASSPCRAARSSTTPPEKTPATSLRVFPKAAAATKASAAVATAAAAVMVPSIAIPAVILC